MMGQHRFGNFGQPVRGHNYPVADFRMLFHLFFFFGRERTFFREYFVRYTYFTDIVK